LYEPTLSAFSQAGSVFFAPGDGFLKKDNAFLDHGNGDFGYAVFAKVTNGMKIIDRTPRSRQVRKKIKNIVPRYNRQW
jgi:cyclophilin family peptidyl-prolyl cis-trans isomerase